MIAAFGFVGVGLAAAAWPSASSLAPNESSPKPFIDVDVSKLEVRTFRLASLQVRPVLVRKWARQEPWIVTQGECSHCSCLLKTLAELTDISNEGLLCPCCASRYDFGGRRLTGPARSDLKAIGFQVIDVDMLRIG